MYYSSGEKTTNENLNCVAVSAPSLDTELNEAKMEKIEFCILQFRKRCSSLTVFTPLNCISFNIHVQVHTMVLRRSLSQRKVAKNNNNKETVFFSSLLFRRTGAVYFILLLFFHCLHIVGGCVVFFPFFVAPLICTDFSSYDFGLS